MPLSRATAMRRQLLLQEQLEQEQQQQRSELGFLHDVFDEQIEATPTRTYCIWDGSHLKIGTTTRHPHERMAALATGNPNKLHLLAWTVTMTESEAHRKYHRYHFRGEWFRAAPGLVSSIATTWTFVDRQVLALVSGAVPSSV